MSPGTADGDDLLFANDAERQGAAQRVAELDSDIDRYKSSRRTAGVVGVGRPVGTGALLGLALGARNRSHTLNRRADNLSVAPFGPGIRGVSLSGRF